MKFANSLALLISKLSYPEEFKNLVDTLGFQHLTTEVTVPRIEVFRDALVELFAADLGDLFDNGCSDRALQNVQLHRRGLHLYPQQLLVPLEADLAVLDLGQQPKE